VPCVAVDRDRGQQSMSLDCVLHMLSVVLQACCEHPCSGLCANTATTITSLNQALRRIALSGTEQAQRQHMAAASLSSYLVWVALVQQWPQDTFLILASTAALVRVSPLAVGLVPWCGMGQGHAMAASAPGAHPSLSPCCG
jgi:hypothetical protein